MSKIKITVCMGRSCCARWKPHNQAIIEASIQTLEKEAAKELADDING